MQKVRISFWNWSTNFQAPKIKLKVLIPNLPVIKGGNRNINLLPLEPLDIPKIHIEQGEESPVNVVLVFKNNTIIGLQDFEFYKIE